MSQDEEVPAKLPDEPGRYFVMDEDTPLVEVARLRVGKADPERIAKAVLAMWAAYRGLGAKREPVEVIDLGDGTYSVASGSSTCAVAARSGWRQVPVRPHPLTSPPRPAPG
jgi:hypothetical protein